MVRAEDAVVASDMAPQSGHEAAYVDVLEELGVGDNVDAPDVLGPSVRRLDGLGEEGGQVGSAVQVVPTYCLFC